MRIAIVGAGMAGLACAERLAIDGHDVELLDQGRVAGGRMSVRHIPTSAGDAVFDSGAQYFTVRDAGFHARVAQWIALGCVAPWPAAGGGAYVGVPGMDAPLRQMCAALAVRFGCRVTALASVDARWCVSVQAGAPVVADAVVVALPEEQAAALVGPTGIEVPARAAAVTAPCWTVMLAFATALETPADCLQDAKDEMLGWAARNGSKPGRPGPEAWVLQARPAWSQRHLHAQADWVVRALSDALAARLGMVLPPPIASSTHRWRYARSAGEGSGAWWDAERRLGLCGDWLLGPRVEAAWMSGTRLAERISICAPPGLASRP